MELTFARPEFEKQVREKLNIIDGPITDRDVLAITDIDLSEIYCCSDELVETLSYFHNLTYLDVSTGKVPAKFWDNFPKMEELFWICLGGPVDFNWFRHMENLNNLCVSGGDYSGIDYLNLDALLGLKKLKYLELHEFGSVDIAPLGSMSQLRYFALRYADKVINIETISKMGFLEELVMDDLWLENADFLDGLPDTVRLEMCGMQFYNDVDVRKWRRFKERDICEIEVKHEYWEYIDLSALND